jgi:hypothetical protein
LNFVTDHSIKLFCRFFTDRSSGGKLEVVLKAFACTWVFLGLSNARVVDLLSRLGAFFEYARELIN